MAYGQRALGAVFTLVWALASATGCDEKPAGGVDSDLAERHRRNAEKFIERLHQLRAAVPPPEQLQEEPCPDADLEHQLDGGYGRMLLVDYEFLQRFGQDPNGVYSGDRSRWSFMSGRLPRDLDRVSRLSGTKRNVEILVGAQKLEREYDHVAVLRTVRREAPRMEGDKFHGGVFDGWLVVFEWDTRRRLCQAEIMAQSSPEVAGRSSQGRDEVLWRDYRRHIDAAMDDAARRLSTRLLLHDD
jgi:hypothetical protein